MQNNISFKAGDRVKFKAWKDMVDEFGCNYEGLIACGDGIFFRPVMSFLCGHEYTVESVKMVRTMSGNTYQYIFLEDEHTWIYSPGMFVFADTPASPEAEVDLNIWRALL